MHGAVSVDFPAPTLFYFGVLEVPERHVPGNHFRVYARLCNKLSGGGHAWRSSGSRVPRYMCFWPPWDSGDYDT